MLNRRKFLSDNFSTVSSFAVGGALSSLGARLSYGESSGNSHLQPVLDETTGLPLLNLPEGFRYVTFGWSGDKMSDGIVTPPAHDGMGMVAADGDALTLIRNHEVSASGGHLPIPKGKPYDAKAYAGCTTLKFNSADGKWLSSNMSFSGTSRNCAGGITPWGTWLTCEETVLGPGDRDKYQNKPRDFSETHGWIFEVAADGSSEPTPLRDMGRFVHEAIAIDRETGIVYETEDRGTSGFYRFLPNEKENLSAGGTLQIAEVVGNEDLRGGVDAGSSFEVRWHTIKDPTLAHTEGTKNELGVFQQGKGQGGTTFARLEGCWYGNGLIYFDATSGGAAKAGQIWQYEPTNQRLTLLFESPSKPVLNMPDNLCVSPQGGIVLCEDNDYGANEYPQRMFTLTQDGKLQLLAENNVVLNKEAGSTRNGFNGDFRTKEWAGATFCPDGKWLFVNIQTPGFTCAITGPWESRLS